MTEAGVARAARRFGATPGGQPKKIDIVRVVVDVARAFHLPPREVWAMEVSEFTRALDAIGEYPPIEQAFIQAFSSTPPGGKAKGKR